MRKGKEYVMTVAAARKVARMLNGESVGYSSFPVSLAEELLEEGVLVQSSYGRRGSYRICDVEGCRTFLAQRYAINGSLEECRVRSRWQWQAILKFGKLVGLRDFS